MAELIEPIKIDGLKDFRRKLKDGEEGLQKQLRVVFNEAAQWIVDEAQPKVPKESGAARGSVRVRSTQTKAKVVAGGSKAPYYPWLDFGGGVGKRKKIKRAWIPDGRYIYPAYRLMRADGTLEDIMTLGLKNLAADAGLDMEVS